MKDTIIEVDNTKVLVTTDKKHTLTEEDKKYIEKIIKERKEQIDKNLPKLKKESEK